MSSQVEANLILYADDQTFYLHRQLTSSERLRRDCVIDYN